MAKVYSFSLENGIDALLDFKSDLLKKHNNQLIIAIDQAIRKLELFGFKINQEWKRDAIKKLDSELYELRVKNARLLLYFDGFDFYIILHCFLKTTMQTPRQHIDIAKKRIRLWKKQKSI